MPSKYERIPNPMPRRHNDATVATLDDLCVDCDVSVGPTDGILLIRATPDGQIIPHVLRHGMLTEGRLEMAMMPIYQEIQRSRMRNSK
jgi:hypothetical protein